MEVAGVVLAIFPLVIQAFAFYDDASKLKGSKMLLRRLVRDLEMERVKFQNTCEYILEDIVPAQVVRTLISGEGWEDVILQDALLRCFRPAVVTVFIEALYDLLTTPQGLNDDLGFGINHLRDPRSHKRILGNLRLVLNDAKYILLLWNESARSMQTCNNWQLNDHVPLKLHSVVNRPVRPQYL
ncbi:hypothetical protein K440DRAFT_636134 [Wilcoxina mikolae CBS 423.85]|nr:hypothetical protein K440DRAFT_636134 [Wilcoxina mikolae CBS 423.85]